MSLVLFGHPFSSYTWKVLIPLYADGTEFEFRQVPENEENYAELKRIWPAGKFPLLLDDGEPVIETTPIIEHLQANYPGPNAWIPDGELGRRVRFLDRVFDLHVQGNMQPAVNHARQRRDEYRQMREKRLASNIPDELGPSERARAEREQTHQDEKGDSDGNQQNWRNG